MVYNDDRVHPHFDRGELRLRKAGHTWRSVDNALRHRKHKQAEFKSQRERME